MEATCGRDPRRPRTDRRRAPCRTAAARSGAASRGRPARRAEHGLDGGRRRIGVDAREVDAVGALGLADRRARRVEHAQPPVRKDVDARCAHLGRLPRRTPGRARGSGPRTFWNVEPVRRSARRRCRPRPRSRGGSRRARAARTDPRATGPPTATSAARTTGGVLPKSPLVPKNARPSSARVRTMTSALRPPADDVENRRRVVGRGPRARAPPARGRGPCDRRRRTARCRAPRRRRACGTGRRRWSAGSRSPSPSAPVVAHDGAKHRQRDEEAAPISAWR